MAIHIPHLMEPFRGTQEEWQAYFKHQRASFEFVQAYRDTIGIFALFSRKKNKRLKEAEADYHKTRDAYLSLICRG